MIQRVKSLIKKEILPPLRKAQLKIQKFVFLLKGPENLDFDFETLPKIDQGLPISDIINTLEVPAKLPYNLEEKLAFFQKHGYVVLEQIYDHKELDGVWKEIDDVMENNDKYEIEAIAHRFNDQKLTPVKDIPKKNLTGIGARLNDYHDSSMKTKLLSTNPFLSIFLEAALEKNIAIFQSLVFKYSSQQAIHQDFPWVTSQIPSHLAAAWIPFEDVHPDSGPLIYYPGSHRMPKFDFGKTGILFKSGKSLMDPEKDFAQFLDKTLRQNKLNGEVLLIKKGDALIWHGGLVHGGTPIKDMSKTRKSLVVHFSSINGLKTHRYAPTPDNAHETINGVRIYDNGHLTHLKNIL